MSDFLERRRDGIGGTDISAILGINPWMTPFDVYMEKTGQAEEQEENDFMYFGKKLEAVVAEAYQERIGRQVQRINSQIVHREHDWMIANIDRAIVNPEIAGRVVVRSDGISTDRGLECKTASAYASRNWGAGHDDMVPDHYALQCQWYMEVCNVPYWDLAALIGGNDFRVFTIERDRELGADLMESGDFFWHRYVVAGVMPDPTTVAEARRKWAQHVESKTSIVGVEIFEAVEKARDIRAEIRRLERERDECDLKIMSAFEDSEMISHQGEILATWRTQTANRIGTNALRDEHPEIAAKYTNATESRVLRLRRRN